MRKINIIILLIICLSSLLLAGCEETGITPEIDSGNSEYQGDTTDTGTVEVDTTKPVITGSRDPLPNSFGWNNTDVTVSFSCADTGPVQSGIDINTVAGETVTTEGKNQSVTNTGECIDAAGNVADPVTVSNINIDKTPPVVTITLPKNGKYSLNESVTATWSATDALSEVEDSKAPKTIKIDTTSKGKKKITLPPGLVKDKAGNSSKEVTTTYEVVEVDTTKPVITGSRDPLPNSFGWNNTDVTVSFSCADTGPVQSGIDINTVAGETVTTEGKNQSVTNTGVCIDAAGNTADPVTISNINIDKTSPVVTITLPGTGEYVLNQSITATWSATDALSGVVSPVSGTVSIDTSSVGTKTFTLPAGTATDKAGNSSLKVTKSYSVIEDTEDPEMTYPQKWATGDGTVENPWANDCIQKAYDFVTAGGTIFLRAGYYQLAGTVTVGKQINLIGEGINKTIIITANARGFQINADYCVIRNLTVDGDAQNDGSHQCINISQADYLLVENIEIKNAGYYGLNMNESNYGIYRNIHAHDNYRHGVHSGANIAGTNQNNIYRDIYCWNNGVDGFDDRGGPDSENNIFDNLQCWDNGRHGIFITTQSNGSLTNSISYNNTSDGIRIYAYSFLLSNCLIYSNTIYGLYIKNCDNVNLVNVISKNNGTSGGANNSGILIYNVPSTKLSSCQFYDDRDSPLQNYGIYAEGTTKYIEITNCKLAPNATSEIKNGVGAVITEKAVIT